MQAKLRNRSKAQQPIMSASAGKRLSKVRSWLTIDQTIEIAKTLPPIGLFLLEIFKAIYK